MTDRALEMRWIVMRRSSGGEEGDGADLTLIAQALARRFRKQRTQRPNEAPIGRWYQVGALARVNDAP